jgi:hypothetical protein
MIENENTEIKVGAGGKLVVPHEDFSSEFDVESELNVASSMVKLRKPGRNEWAFYYLNKEISVKLLIHKKNPDGMDSEIYYVEHGLRSGLADELKTVRIIPYYSFSSKTIGLWPLNVNVGLSWYDSAAVLLRQSREFIEANVIRIVSDKANSRYQIRYKSIPTETTIPELERETGELLGEALGEERFIRSVDHPLYRELTEGSSL